LEGCADLVPGTLRLEVASAHIRVWKPPTTWCCYSEFADRAALDAYQNHPTHVAVKPFLPPWCSERQCMDYTDHDPRTIQQLFDLKGKTALVTGGSRGLGLQMAHALGEAGARIMLSSRKADDLEEATAELQAAGIDARWIAADCAKEADIRRLADETLERMGDIDILVNNAGAAWGAPAEDHPVDAWDKVMNLNVRGYFILSQHIAKHSMIPRKRAASSTWRPSPAWAATRPR
jgi:hypothetical protein